MSTLEIGSGTDATVELQQESMVVFKRFRTVDAAQAVSLARREYQYLQRFSKALRDQVHIRCPEPTGKAPEQGSVEMSFCPGVQVEALLAASGGIADDDLHHIAALVATGLEIYIDEFNEPYDLATNNLIYHSESKTLYLIDFSRQTIFGQVKHFEAPLETSLGGFLGYALYNTIRPSTINNRAFWMNLEGFLVAILSEVHARNQVSLPLVEQISHVAYRSAGSMGSRKRWLWYAAVGEVIFRKRRRAILAQVR